MEPEDEDTATEPESATEYIARPWRGEILHVTGRGSDDSRGLPPVHELTVSDPNGAPLTFGPIKSDDVVDVRVHAYGAPPVTNFGVCPICGATDDLTREHVPQGDLGGTVMTRTCRACNSGLGSRVEDELKDWFDDAIGQVRFSGGDVPGARKAPRVLLRTTTDGQVGLIIDVGKVDPAIEKMLTSGAAQIEYRIPVPVIWRLAALKHAYLGACLALGEIPNTPHAEQVRADLIAARDWRRGETFPESRIAGGLRVAQTYRAAQGPTVVLASLINDDGEPVDHGLSFAGTLFVSWPLDASLFWEAAQRVSAPDPPASPRGAATTPDIRPTPGRPPEQT